MRAARYLGVPPWELAAQPRWWLEAALTAESAEEGAKAQLRERSHGRHGF